MKRVFTASFLAFGIILISGCSLNKQKSVDNSTITQQITTLQAQISEISTQMKTLKSKNEQLKTENQNLKTIIEQNINKEIDTTTINKNREISELVLNNWQIYNNTKNKFEISYPKDWVYEEFDFGILFGLPESKPGGYQWSINIYSSSELEKVIAQMGYQFEDRKESRGEITINEDIVGTIVTVTTNKYPDWVFKTIYFKNNDQLFAIGNGAIADDRFETFYKSFKFTK